MKYAFILLATLTLAACGSTGTIEEPLATGGTLVTNDAVPSTPIALEAKDSQPQVSKTVALEATALDNGVIIQVMDRMDAQGCLFEKVALTTSRQWNQFVLKCNAPTEIPDIE